MKLLVTGGSGFIGSHFIRRWLARHPGDQLVNLDALTYAGSADRLADLDGVDGYRFIEGNICDPEAVAQAMEGCTTVVHLAAETHVDRSITDANPFLRTNVEGTQVLLAVAGARGVRRVLHVSTDEVYGPILQGAVDECAPLAPHSPYAASKAAGDLLAQAHRITYQLPVIVARPTNVYGPAQLPEKFIPLCIANSLEERAVPLYGDGQQRRNWLYVEDLCDALALLIQRGRVGEIYNIGSGSEQANVDTARLILSRLQRPERLITFVDDRPGHDRRYCMDDRKLTALGWSPRVTFEHGLTDTVTWYVNHATWWQPLVQKLREDPYHWLHRAARPGAGRAAVPVG